MKAKDSIFIILTIALLILFGIVISENLESVSFQRKEEKVENVKNSSGILSRLEELGLAPREAKYYRVTE